MKKFWKNVILSLLIIYFILSIINLMGQVIREYTINIPGMIRYVEELSEQGIPKDETYTIIASVYSAGYGNKIEIQTGILGISLVLSIIIALVITFEEKSKLKIFLKYILGLLIVALIPTLIYIFYYMDFGNFLSDFTSEMIYNIENLWGWYTFVFIIIYIVKIYINNKKIKELNEILDNKKKKVK